MAQKQVCDGQMVLSCINNFATKKDSFVTNTNNFNIEEKNIVMAVVGHGNKTYLPQSLVLTGRTDSILADITRPPPALLAFTLIC